MILLKMFANKMISYFEYNYKSDSVINEISNNIILLINNFISGKDIKLNISINNETYFSKLHRIIIEKDKEIENLLNKIDNLITESTCENSKKKNSIDSNNNNDLSIYKIKSEKLENEVSTIKNKLKESENTNLFLINEKITINKLLSEKNKIIDDLNNKLSTEKLSNIMKTSKMDNSSVNGDDNFELSKSKNKLSQKSQSIIINSVKTKCDKSTNTEIMFNELKVNNKIIELENEYKNKLMLIESQNRIGLANEMGKRFELENRKNKIIKELTIKINSFENFLEEITKNNALVQLKK